MAKMRKIFWTIAAILVASRVDLTAANSQLPPPPINELPTVEDGQIIKLVRTLEGHAAAIDSMAFSPDGQILMSGGSYNDPLLRFWWVNTGREIESLRAQRTAVSNLIISPNGKTLVSSGEDGL